MAHDCFPVGMDMMGIGKPRSLLVEIPESDFSQAIIRAQRQISAELIDSDWQNQAGRHTGKGKTERQEDHMDETQTHSETSFCACNDPRRALWSRQH